MPVRLVRPRLPRPIRLMSRRANKVDKPTRLLMARLPRQLTEAEAIVLARGRARGKVLARGRRRGKVLAKGYARGNVRVFPFSLIGIWQSNVVSKNGRSNILGSLRNEAKANEADKATDANTTDANMVNETYDTIMPAKANADETNEANKANKADELTSRRG
jgi:hypothetical protein